MTTPAPFLTPLHYIIPPILFIPLIFVLLPKPKPIEPIEGIRPITVQRITPRKSTISTCLLLLSLLAFGDIIILVSDLVTERTRNGDQPSNIPEYLKGASLAGEVIYTLGQLIVYGLALAGVWWREKWQSNALVTLATLAFGLEIPNLVGLVLREVHTHGYDKIFTILSLVPSSSRLLGLPILIVALLSPRVTYEPADERTGLLSESAVDGRMDQSSTEYGTFDSDSQDPTKTATTTTGAPSTPVPGAGEDTSNTNDNSTTALAAAVAQANKIKITKKLGVKKKEEKKDELSLREIWPKFKTLIPRLWPAKSLKLQFFAAMTGVTILVDRVLTPLSPISMGFLIRALTERNQYDIWKWLFIYLSLRLLNAYGTLSALQQAFWLPIVQYTDREMQMLCFNHILDLSLAYHTKRNTGEVMRIIERGSAVNNLFRTVLFSVIPTFADIAIGFSVFMWLFGPIITFTVLLFMIPYLCFTYYSTKFRKYIRQEYVDKDVQQRGVVSDVLTNWESVKYFTGETREVERFTEAVNDLQRVEWQWDMGYQAIYAIQSLLLTLGFASGAILLSWNIMRGIGDAALFVIFIQYYGAFTTPLNQLSSLYRSINTNITDSEKMLKLLAETTEIKDSPDATELVLTDGTIEFDNVSFTYDDKVQALKNVSFKLGKGESMALVGETGSGKSTILKLIYRFYEVTEGRILIDHQDISKVTQSSLRNAIGIVPQDSVLWNDTIGANIAYGKPGAEDEEVIAAAMRGRIHDKIMTFDEGYDTLVGERGKRLSGGEKQRVSLARMFLKNPAILVLDEATSALDTETEREIQKSLAALSKGKSSLSIAHRLSTIINSDKIAVMKEGQLIEIGTYNELIGKQDGTFARMWKRQIYTEAELLDDDDLAKVADTLPTADDLRYAHAHPKKSTHTKDDKDDDNDNNDKPDQATQEPATGGSSSFATPVAATDESPALIDLEDKTDDKPAEGLTVESPPPPPIVDNPENVSFADAVKSPSDESTAAPAGQLLVAQPAEENQDKRESTPHEVEPTSAATGPASVVEIQDPIATSTPAKVEPEEASETPKPAPAPTTASPETPSVPFPPSPPSTRKEGSVSISLDSPRKSTEASSSPGKAFPTESPKPASVAFPSSASKPVNTKRWSTMSASPSIASALSSTGGAEGSSPSKSETSQTPSGDKDKGDKRRKRLSSIKGFVRRISDQGLTRSPSGLRSPASEDLPTISGNNENEADERTPLVGGLGEGEGTQQRERKVSTHGGKDDKKLAKKKKKHGKH
ncbi:hypothetical protein I302_101975 [Kwoniella bestiolae CBS 10118]|uniref:ABC transporter n=1 Tax=Kwoniella bestiolae CBS 10118 TaxID=1296100 RepID=A0A1B9GDR2_9TREE|nr:hypothetical protein I302_00659 [Kwoniella bestiolae CBS 10118]OCF29163.1 hypothetical protein I302_00659 [Kwoniella bestiolae CBS 10118]